VHISHFEKWPKIILFLKTAKKRESPRRQNGRGGEKNGAYTGGAERWRAKIPRWTVTSSKGVMPGKAVTADCDTCKHGQLFGQHGPIMARQVGGLTGDAL